MAQRFYLPIPQIFTDLGVLAPGWKLYFYQTGTTTPLAVYSDTGLTSQLPNPVLTNDEGHLVDGSNNITSIYFSSAALYKVILTDENDVPQWTADPCDPNTSTLATLSPRPVYYAGITTGTSTAYVLASNPVFTSYSSTDTFELTFHTASGASPTLQYVSGGAALSLKKYYAGTKLAIGPNELQNQTYTVRNDGTDVVVLNLDPASSSSRGRSLLPVKPSITNGTDTLHDIDFGAYTMQFSDGSGQAPQTAKTKQADATWAAGTNAGGMASGVSLGNNTAYYMFALSNATGSLVDFGFDSSKTATNLIASSAVTTYFGGTPKWQYIGGFRTDGSAQIRNGTYTFAGSNFYKFTYKDGGTIDSTTNPGTGSRTLYPLSVLPSSEAIFYTQVGTLTNPGTQYFLYLTNPDQTDQTTTPNVEWTQGSNENMNFTCGPHSILTDSSSQIGGRLNVTTTTFSIYTKGWIEYL